MVRRLLTVSLLSFAVAVSSAGVLAAEAATPAAPSVSVPSVQQATTTTSATPTLTCGSGLVATVCSLVLGPICKDRCGAATSTQTGAAATGTSVSAPRAAATSASAPTLYCQPSFQLVCEVLGLTVCRNGCAVDAATMSTASAPTIYCDIDVVCLILALTVCRNGCMLNTGASVAAADVALPDPGQLCTVDIRPVNPFCLLP